MIGFVARNAVTVDPSTGRGLEAAATALASERPSGGGAPEKTSPKLAAEVFRACA